MSLTRLPSGRWRSQVWSPALGRNVSVGTFDTKREAKTAREQARAKLGRGTSQMTVGQWADRWTSDPIFRRPKESTNLHNAERVRAFVKAHGTVRLAQVDDRIVSAWLEGGRRSSQVQSLRAMFGDAASAKGGRLIPQNPFAGLGLERGPGRRHEQPPSEETVWQLIAKAREVASPSFAAWLQTAAFTGMRPGELDALRWDRVDFERSRIDVVEQFSAKSRKFTPLKNGKRRDAILTPQAREALLSVARESEFCFVNLQGGHWSTSSRAYHWKAVRSAVGYDGSLYLATRHFAGWFMVNVLRMPSEDVAFALGHEDGGNLVRLLYGHLSRDEALSRVLGAYEGAGRVVPLRAVKNEEAS